MDQWGKVGTLIPLISSREGCSIGGWMKQQLDKTTTSPQNLWIGGMNGALNRAPYSLRDG